MIFPFPNPPYFPHIHPHLLYIRKILTLQAEDGTRVDEAGESFYPPSGNGIKAAVAGILPKAGAVTSGETTTDPSESIQPNGLKSPPSFADLATAGGVGGSVGKGVNGNGVGAAGVDVKDTGLENGIEELKVADSDADALESEVQTPTPTPPTADTAVGRPEGEVVFDHPPSKEEKEEVKGLESK